jgi:nucleoside-diphosphate kinase
MERTLFIVKPDAVERNLIGKILAHVEGHGFRVVQARLARLRSAEAEVFYAEHKERPFFPDLVAYMTSGPVLLLGLEREDAVKLREAVGATDPAQAESARCASSSASTSGARCTPRTARPADRELRFFFTGELARIGTGEMG